MIVEGRDICEIKSGGEWRVVDIDEALDRRGEIMRCPACHGRLRAHRQGTTDQRAHFEHMRAHAGCPIKSTFSGRRSRHPDAID